MKNSNSALRYFLKNGKAIDLLKIKRAYKLINALYHPLRQKMYELICENPYITVTDIFIKLRLEQSVASRHLKWFRDAGIVVTERNGKNVHYSINHDVVYHIEEIVKGVSQKEGKVWEKTALDILKCFLNSRKLLIIELIAVYQRTIVSYIYNDLKIEQSACSQSLGDLRKLSVVTSEREGKNIHYELNDDFIDNIRFVLNKELKSIDSVLEAAEV